MNSPAHFHLKHIIQLRRMSAIALTLLLLATVAFGDTIKLKNGSVIKGRVVGYSQGEFTVILDLGSSSRRSTTRMIIAAEDIESIEFEGSEGGTTMSQPETSRPSSTSRPPAPKTVTEPPTRPENESQSATPPRRAQSETPSTPIGSQPSSATPSGPLLAEKEIRVVASVDWTNTNIRVQKGQRISITSTGEIDLGKSRRSGPSGIDLIDPGKLIEDRQTGALIAVIGDDNNDFIFVGRQSEFTAAHSGFLYLSVNERDLKDNSGSYIARVRISGSK